MRKFVLTDDTGRTAVGARLAPGKFIQNLGKDDPMARVQDGGGDTPLLAALMSPFPAARAQMFAIKGKLPNVKWGPQL